MVEKITIAISNYSRVNPDDERIGCLGVKPEMFMA